MLEGESSTAETAIRRMQYTGQFIYLTGANGVASAVPHAASKKVGLGRNLGTRNNSWPIGRTAQLGWAIEDLEALSVEPGCLRAHE